MRKETPDQFFVLIKEYLHPARPRTWSNGIQALLPMIADSTFVNFPTILDIVEPIIMAAPTTLQLDLEELIIALYRASPTETTFLLKQVISTTENPMTAVTLRRISSSFPLDLQNEVRDYIRAQPISPPVQKIEEDESPSTQATPDQFSSDEESVSKVSENKPADSNLEENPNPTPTSKTKGQRKK